MKPLFIVLETHPVRARKLASFVNLLVRAKTLLLCFSLKLNYMPSLAPIPNEGASLLWQGVPHYKLPSPSYIGSHFSSVRKLLTGSFSTSLTLTGLK